MNLYRLLKSFEKHRIDKVSEMIDGTNLNILEIGCSDGKFLYDNRHKWQSITGVDIRNDLLKKARQKKYGVKAEFYTDDFGRNSMPYKTNHFDLVISIATIQYIFSLDLLFDEIRRVLKNNGLFIFEIPNVAVFWRRLQFLFGHFPNTSYESSDWESGVVHYFTRDNLTRILTKKGFVIEKVSCSGILASIREKWASFLGADLIFVCRKVT